MKLLLKDVDLDWLRVIFEGVNFSLYRTDDEDEFISCFLVTFPDEEKCRQEWLNITNVIALNYQQSLTIDAQAWNIYIAIVVPVTISRQLKYVIENDRFAARKLVLDGPKYAGQGEFLAFLALEDAILGNDLKIAPSEYRDEPAVNEGEYRNHSDSRLRVALSSIDILPLDGRDASVRLRKNQIEILLSLNIFESIQ